VSILQLGSTQCLFVTTTVSHLYFNFEMCSKCLDSPRGRAEGSRIIVSIIIEVVVS
jgi:hypothetical protein